VALGVRAILPPAQGLGLEGELVLVGLVARGGRGARGAGADGKDGGRRRRVRRLLLLPLRLPLLRLLLLLPLAALAPRAVRALVVRVEAHVVAGDSYVRGALGELLELGAQEEARGRDELFLFCFVCVVFWAKSGGR
jgi:hypothetical protein